MLKKIFFSLIFIMLVILLLAVYWFIPFETIEFKVKPSNSNFSLNLYDSRDMQFYENMRFPDSKISYHIDDCPLQKKNDMEEAFKMISNLSVLNFYQVDSNEEIYVTCDSKNRIEDSLFIAGEGGPTNISKSGKFNVIFHGKVLLIKDSKCEKPNIAIHELLHVLGFNHSDNSDNVMYYVSSCKQNIGEDQLNLINGLYSIPSYSDLALENVSAIMHGKYLGMNISIRNQGLKNSEKSTIIIYADEKPVKEIELDVLKIGYGKLIMLNNIWIKQINIKSIGVLINSTFEELEKNNNKVELEIK